MVTLRTTVLGICENDVAWSAGKGVSQIMQGAGNDSKPVCTMFAKRTGTPFIIAAAPYKFWSELPIKIEFFEGTDDILILKSNQILIRELK